ncbi:MAG: reprolysin-like metallopeptidase, partial [Fimbriimonadales bacterium]
MILLGGMVAAVLVAGGFDDVVDSDSDGLPDTWEVSGHGPIDPKAHGCSPKRSDFFLVVCLRHGMTQDSVKGTLDQLKKFFGAMPNKNLDGSTGINVIPVWGNQVEEEDNGKGYPDLYDHCMKDWRGIGHGVLLDSNTGGGGQANRPDWAGCSNNWWTIAHELGHQFGLDH